jgi:hypothetical protein
MGYIDGAIRSGERAEQEVLAVHQSGSQTKAVLKNEIGLGGCLAD